MQLQLISTLNGEIIPGRWQAEVNGEIQALNTETPPINAKKIQNIFKDHFLQYARI